MSDKFLEDTLLINEVTASTTSGKSLYDRIGGRPALERAHKIFYDKLYAHPWLKGYFEGIDQTKIENQQSDFIAQITGGPKEFGGRMPHHAHAHIFISEELFLIRNDLLRESLIEAEVPEKEREEWLNVDRAFKRAVVKKSLEQCQKRYVDEDIIIIPNPLGPMAS